MFLGSVQLHCELLISSSFSKKCLTPARLADTGFSKIIISSKLRQCVAMAHESLVSSNLIGYLRVRILSNYVIGFISFFVVVSRMVIKKIWGEILLYLDQLCINGDLSSSFLLECQFFTFFFIQSRRRRGFDRRYFWGQ